MTDYHNHYLKKDVLLLADVFEKFINMYLTNFYKLDPSRYFNSPGLSWNAMLKMTGMKLELISDINMNLFIEKGLISYICKRFSKTNSKYLKNYDPTKEDKFIMCSDENNLCGWVMSQYLP